MRATSKEKGNAIYEPSVGDRISVFPSLEGAIRNFLISGGVAYIMKYFQGLTGVLVKKIRQNRHFFERLEIFSLDKSDDIM